MNELFEHLSKEESIALLKALKLRKRLQKNLGNRSARVLDTLAGVHTLRIEHALSLDSAAIGKLMAKIFGPEYADGFVVSLVPKESLTGGLRAFFDDDMIDLSFLRARNILSQY